MKSAHPPNGEKRTVLEQRIAAWVRPKLPFFAAEFLIFGLKQAWACLYAGAMLVLIMGTKLIWKPEWVLARYDFLTVSAVPSAKRISGRINQLGALPSVTTCEALTLISSRLHHTPSPATGHNRPL